MAFIAGVNIVAITLLSLLFTTSINAESASYPKQNFLFASSTEALTMYCAEKIKADLSPQYIPVFHKNTRPCPSYQLYVHDFKNGTNTPMTLEEAQQLPLSWKVAADGSEIYPVPVAGRKGFQAVLLDKPFPRNQLYLINNEALNLNVPANSYAFFVLWLQGDNKNITKLNFPATQKFLFASSQNPIPAVCFDRIKSALSPDYKLTVSESPAIMDKEKCLPYQLYVYDFKTATSTAVTLEQAQHLPLSWQPSSADGFQIGCAWVNQNFCLQKSNYNQSFSPNIPDTPENIRVTFIGWINGNNK